MAAGCTCAGLLQAMLWSPACALVACKYWPQIPTLHSSSGCRTFNIIHPHETIPRVIWGFRDTISVGLLPIAGFPNGHAFFTQRLYEVSSPAVGS